MTLDDWGPRGAFPHIVRYTQSNWGEAPMTFQEATVDHHNAAQLEAVFAGRTLPQVLEGLTFWFTIDGCSRATTHQLVRSRFAAFMQHGGRDNDWRHRNWTMPETIRRAVVAYDQEEETDSTQTLCVTSWEPLRKAVAMHDTALSLSDLIESVIADAHTLYAALVDAGIPWQDARRVLPMGTQTYIHGIYNYVSLRDMLANRLEHIMDWEINCVAQLMLRQIRLNCPEVVWKNLGSHSDRQGRAAFAGLESWPPDEKYPVPPEMSSLPRTHRSEQNPFWVLHPDSWDGGPVRWIPTNGRYPHEVLKNILT